ncbi:MAG: hypothetical protein K0Q43_1459 [Ramlibacter sp.]|nr:hypothetical protein [Ramlibacter sp.]
MPIDNATTSVARLQAFIDRCPFNRWMGMRALAATPDSVELSVAWKQDFVSHPGRQSTHGGILAGIVDAAADYAVALHVGEPVPTVDLRIDFHRTATPGDLRAEARVIHVGGTLATAEARIFSHDGKLVASGRGVYFTGALKANSEKAGVPAVTTEFI